MAPMSHGELTTPDQNGSLKPIIDQNGKLVGLTDNSGNIISLTPTQRRQLEQGGKKRGGARLSLDLSRTDSPNTTITVRRTEYHHHGSGDQIIGLDGPTIGALAIIAAIIGAAISAAQNSKPLPTALPLTSPSTPTGQIQFITKDDEFLRRALQTQNITCFAQDSDIGKSQLQEPKGPLYLGSVGGTKVVCPVTP